MRAWDHERMKWTVPDYIPALVHPIGIHAETILDYHTTVANVRDPVTQARILSDSEWFTVESVLRLDVSLRDQNLWTRDMNMAHRSRS